MANAQVSLEFLFSISILLIMLMLSIAIYVSNLDEATRVRDALEATRICLQVSSAAGALMSSGANATTSLSLPKYLNGQNYTIFLSSERNSVKVDYASYGVGCQFPSFNITNSSGATLFRVAKNATMNYNGGAIVVSP